MICWLLNLVIRCCSLLPKPLSLSKVSCGRLSILRANARSLSAFCLPKFCSNLSSKTAKRRAALSVICRNVLPASPISDSLVLANAGSVSTVLLDVEGVEDVGEI